MWNKEIFFLKNHIQNAVEKLVQDFFIKESKLSVSLKKQSEIL